MPYSTLFRIECLHGYFGGGLCRSLSLAPAGGCKALLDRYRLLFRGTPGGCSVYAPPQSPLNLLRRFDEAVPFTFRLTNTDPLLESYTDLDRGPSSGPAESLFHFDNAAARQAEVFGAERLLLNDPAAPLADAALPVMPFIFDFPRVSSPASDQSLKIVEPLSGQTLWHSPAIAPSTAPSAPIRADLRSLPEGRYHRVLGETQLTPFFLSHLPAARQWGAISIYIGGQAQSPHLPGACQSIDAAGEVTSRTFTLALQSRSTYWRYYVIDPAGKQDFGSYELIATLRNPPSRTASSEIVFLRSPQPVSIDGRAAWVFESQSPLPLLYSPSSLNLALTLRPANGKHGERALALPYAQPTGLVYRNQSQPHSWCSEVFVYV